MNSVQEPDLIEKTQAWSAMKEMVLVSQLNCGNVLSRTGEGEREREKYKMSRRQQTERLGQIKLFKLLGDREDKYFKTKIF